MRDNKNARCEIANMRDNKNARLKKCEIAKMRDNNCEIEKCEIAKMRDNKNSRAGLEQSCGHGRFIMADVKIIECVNYSKEGK